MSTMRLVRGVDLQLHSTGRVWPPDRWPAITTAQDLLSRCEEQVLAAQRAASSQALQQAQQGYEDGLMRGAQNASERLLLIEKSHAAALAARPQEVADLVMLVLERLAPALAPGELVRALARQAVAHSAPSPRVLFKVNPACVDAVQDELYSLRQGSAWLDSVTVLGVAQMPEDACVLETPHGIVNASWATQLAALHGVLAQLATAEDSTVAASAPGTDR